MIYYNEALYSRADRHRFGVDWSVDCHKVDDLLSIFKQSSIIIF